MFKAPEIHNDEEYDGKSIDIFALGVTLFFIVFGKIYLNVKTYYLG